MQGCGNTFMKHLLFIFNFIIWIFGGAILGLAIWLRVDGNALGVLVDESWYVAAYIMMGIGGIIFIIAFLGCFGALRESPCLLGTYFAFMLVIFISEIAGAIYAGINRQMIEAEVKTRLTADVMDKYNQKGFNAVTQAVDYVQAQLKCCGVTSPDNWKDSKFAASVSAVTVNGPPVPDSCCVTESNDCGIRARPTEQSYNQTIFQQGCYPRIEQIIDQSLTIAIVVLSSVAVIEVLGLTLSMALLVAIRRSNTV